MIRPKHIILAAGALERPLTFTNNDKPGVMLSTAVRGFVNRYAVAPGRRVAIVTTNDDGYCTARDLKAAGVDVAVVADTRQELSETAEQVASLGISVRAKTMPKKALGGIGVEGIRLQTVNSGAVADYECDVIAMAGGYNPSIHLLSQGGNKPQWQDEVQGFIAGEGPDAVTTAGACRGVYDLSDCIAGGVAAGASDGDAGSTTCSTVTTAMVTRI